MGESGSEGYTNIFSFNFKLTDCRMITSKYERMITSYDRSQFNCMAATPI